MFYIRDKIISLLLTVSLEIVEKIQVPGKTMFLHKNKHVSQDILVNTFKHWKIDKHNLFFFGSKDNGKS